MLTSQAFAARAHRQGLLLASQFVSINSEQAKNYYIYEILRSFARLSELRGGKAGITVITRELDEPAVEASGDEKQGAVLTVLTRTRMTTKWWSCS